MPGSGSAAPTSAASRTSANPGVGGIPVIAIANGTVAPLDDGKRSRVTISCEFQGHGIGKLLVPLLVRRLAKQLPRDGQKLKEVLERGSLSGGRAPVHHDPAALSRVPDESGRDHEVRD